MAQKDQQLIFERAPYVDLIVGPGQLSQTADLIERVRRGDGRQTALSLGRRDGSTESIRRSHETFDPLRDPEMRPTPFQAYLRIQIGCDKFCTYCVVPMTRGPEQGRPPRDPRRSSPAGRPRLQGDHAARPDGQQLPLPEGDRTTTLADLLVKIHEIDGLERLKFVTNYPKDMTASCCKRCATCPSAPATCTCLCKAVRTGSCSG
jgi:tRNA-2-methylthio-N6-dimethylallyladenosine synthase